MAANRHPIKIQACVRDIDAELKAINVTDRKAVIVKLEKLIADFSNDKVSIRKIGYFYEVNMGMSEEGVRCYMQAAEGEDGDPVAMYYVAVCLQHGSGVNQNQKLAMDSYERAAKKGHPESIGYVAIDYITQARQIFASKEIQKKALEWATKCAELVPVAPKAQNKWLHDEFNKLVESIHEAKQYIAMRAEEYKQTPEDKTPQTEVAHPTRAIQKAVRKLPIKLIDRPKVAVPPAAVIPPQLIDPPKVAVPSAAVIPPQLIDSPKAVVPPAAVMPRIEVAETQTESSFLNLVKQAKNKLTLDEIFRIIRGADDAEKKEIFEYCLIASKTSPLYEYILAQCYENGIGTLHDSQKALEIFVELETQSLRLVENIKKYLSPQRLYFRHPTEAEMKLELEQLKQATAAATKEQLSVEAELKKLAAQAVTQAPNTGTANPTESVNGKVTLFTRRKLRKPGAVPPANVPLKPSSNN